VTVPGRSESIQAKFTFYPCDDDLARRWTELIKREDELRELIEKANENAAGAVIGSVAYRSDYEAVLAQEKMVQRTGRKRCGFMADYQSDHIVR
jgi:ethanolamine ammonia-lyase large subunit